MIGKEEEFGQERRNDIYSITEEGTIQVHPGWCLCINLECLML